MYRVQIYQRPGRWTDFAAPGCDPELWTDLDDAWRFAGDFMARRGHARHARVVRDADDEIVWPDPGPPAAAAFARVNDLLERLGGARSPHEGGHAYRVPKNWRPASLHALAEAELTPHGYEVSLRGRTVRLRYGGPTAATAPEVLAACRRLNRRYGHGRVLRIEFTGPLEGRAVVEVGGLDDLSPFTVHVQDGRRSLQFVGRFAALR